MILLNADYIPYILFEISLGFSRNIRRFFVSSYRFKQN